MLLPPPLGGALQVCRKVCFCGISHRSWGVVTFSAGGKKERRVERACNMISQSILKAPPCWLRPQVGRNINPTFKGLAFTHPGLAGSLYSRLIFVLFFFHLFEGARYFGPFFACFALCIIFTCVFFFFFPAADGSKTGG